jgi:hypothetical protein
MNKWTKITKKKFEDIRTSGEIRLVNAYPRKTKDDVFNAIKAFLHINKEIQILDVFETFPVSRLDLRNQGERVVGAVYTMNFRGINLYVYEERVDYSKDSTCSWNDVVYTTILYVEKKED